MAVIKTPRHDLETYTDGEDAHPGRETFNAEVAKLEAMPAVKQGSTGSRPLSGVGKVLYWDEAAKRFQYDDGTEWQDVAPIGGVTPTAVAIGGLASEGTSPRAARGDHTHDFPLASPTQHGAMSSGDKAKLDEATANANPSTLARRTSTGQIGVASPTSGIHATSKQYVDLELVKKAEASHKHPGSDITGIIDPARIANATDTLDGLLSKSDKSLLDARTVAATPGTIPLRGVSGEINVGATISAAHAARKDYVDGKKWNASDTTSGVFDVARLPAATTASAGTLSSVDKEKLNSSTVNATPNTLAYRGLDGRVKVGTPLVSDDSTTKAYVDSRIARGQATFTITSGNSGTVVSIEVSFPQGQFTTPPTVTLGPVTELSTNTEGPALGTVTKDGFTLRTIRNITGPFIVHWIAVA